MSVPLPPGASLGERLAVLGAAERRVRLAGLSDAELAELEHHWPAWARTAQLLGIGDPALFDARNGVEVVLLHDGMTLLSCADDALAAGANMAMLGDELIQFGSAERIAPARWRLSRLLRGRRGSEAAIPTHVAGEPFVMIEPDTLVAIASTPDRIGAELRVIVAGVGDPIGVEAAANVTARALRPPHPVHLAAEPVAGGLRFSWVRRSRLGWSWTDGGEVSLGEEAERYRLTINPSAGTARVTESAQPAFDYSPDLIAADGAEDAAWFAVEVMQLGLAGASAAVSATFNSKGERL